jgi:hypothetical protein
LPVSNDISSRPTVTDTAAWDVSIVLILPPVFLRRTEAEV